MLEGFFYLRINISYLPCESRSHLVVSIQSLCHNFLIITSLGRSQMKCSCSRIKLSDSWFSHYLLMYFKLLDIKDGLMNYPIFILVEKHWALKSPLTSGKVLGTCFRIRDSWVGFLFHLIPIMQSLRKRKRRYKMASEQGYLWNLDLSLLELLTYDW